MKALLKKTRYPAQYKPAQHPAQYQHPAQHPAQYHTAQHPAQYKPAQPTYRRKPHTAQWSFAAYLSGATAFSGMFVWSFILALGESGVNPFILNSTHVFGVGFTFAGLWGFMRFLATGHGKVLFVFTLAFGLAHGAQAYVSSQAADKCYLKNAAGNYDPRRSGACFVRVQNEVLNRVLGGIK
jgi:hypothetical protein